VHRFNHDSNRYEKSEEGAAGWGGLRIGQFERKPDEKNLVLISLDTCRTKSLSKNGNTRPTSPFLDQLAKSSVDFLQASSPSSWTLPAHMSLFTGRYPSWHTMTYNRDSHFHELPLEIPLLTNHLREKGYLGVAFTGGAKLASSFGYYRGFDWYQENLNTDADAVINFSDAIKWIKKNRKKKFYLFLHTYEIHTPYTHPIFLENNYSEGESALALYEGDINFTDAWLTRFMKIMDELDLSKKTVFIITSDHGEEFEERGLGLYYQHGHTLKDELIKIPLLIYAPNFLRPQKVDKYQISLVDVMPTVFDLIGAPLDATSQNSIAGKNLSQYVLNGNWPDESYAFSEITTYAPARYSVRYSTGNAMYKFTVSPDTVFPAYTESIRKNIFGELSVAEEIHRFAEKEETRSYFDLIADPHEKNPLSLNTRFPRQRLEELMHKYLDGFQDLRGIVTQSTLTDEEVKKNLKTLGY
jgi:arylsulfatase A-like enzyme